MTLTELKDEVLALGFDNVNPLDEVGFTAAANRALRGLYADRAIMGTVKFFLFGQKPLSHVKEIRHIGNQELTLPLAGRAYSMRICGKGSFTVYDRETEHTVEFDTEGSVEKGFLTADGRIVFSGELSYTVYDLVTYAEIFSDNKEDIPDGAATVCYDLRERVGDFYAFTSPPRDRLGNILYSVRLEDGRMYISSSYRGEVILSYRRLPKRIYSESSEAQIDLPEEYSHLLPLLVASYIWLDDDPDKAEHYKKLYDAALSAIGRDSVELAYTDTYGWT